MRATIAAGLLLLLTACGAPSEPVESPEPTGPALELLTTIGCGDCEGVDALAVVSVDFTQDLVVIRDRYEPLVRVFDLDGQAVHAFGVFGEGPGEFNPIELPTYAAQDGRLFSYGLTSLQEHSLEGDFVAAYDWPMRLPLSQHFEAETARLTILAAPPPMQGAAAERQVEVIEYRPGAEEFGPHQIMPADALPYISDGVRRPAVSTMAAAPDGRIVLANGTDYILYWYDSDHQFVSRMGTDGVMPRMPPAERRRREEINLRNQRLATEIPDHTPYLGSEALDFDGQGRLWVRTLRWSGIGDERTATEFDVYSPDGVLVGVVVVAVRFVENWPTVSVRGDVLAGAYVDEDGHHRVGVWRIVG